MTENIYLDYNASTPILSEVKEAMLPFLSEHYGNPSTTHWAAKSAKEALEKARTQCARLLQCESSEIVFTSGGSESNNYVLKGVYSALKEKGNHIITTKIEHPAIMQPCQYLESIGAKVTYVGVDQFGMVSPEDIEKAITKDTILVSVMHANNEVGTIQPLQAISKITKKHNILLHTDAAQSVGKIPTEVDELGVDLLTIAGHKLYAPKGVGALYIRKGTPIETFMHGAGHESGRRAGTENILLVVGLGEACQLAISYLADNDTLNLREYFWQRLQALFQDKVVLNGHPTKRLPNTINVSFANHIGSELLDKMPQIAASTGAACHSGKVELSTVLKEMGVQESIGKGTIRFSLGRNTTKEEIDVVISLLKENV
jgi:cysteine desulfurase